MIYCTYCGQCIHINEDSFIEYFNTSGWESRHIDPETGEVIDYGDSETTDCESDYIECPHCNSNNIEFDSNINAEEAFDKRAEYETNMKTARKQLEREQANAKTKNSEWDHSVNPV